MSEDPEFWNGSSTINIKILDNHHESMKKNALLQENHSFATDISVVNPLQTYKNPLQISISNGFATEVFCCKKPCCNFAHFGIRLQKTNGFATELFRCYIATNFTSVAHSVAKSQKLKDNE